MSEDRVAKLEKLEKRRQQLAKWKLKKKATEVPSEASSADKTDTLSDSPARQESADMKDEKSSEISPSIADLKKIERQRKLEEWKRKKQQAQSGLPTSQPRKEDVLIAERLNDANVVEKASLDSWKVKKSGLRISSSNGGVLSAIPRKRKAASRILNVFGEEEDNEFLPGPLFKAPEGKKSNYNRGDDSSKTKEIKPSNSEEKDELDVFLESLEDSQMAELPENIKVNGENGENGGSGTESNHTDHSHTFPKASIAFPEDSDEEEDYDDDEKLISTRMKSFGKGKELTKIDHEEIEYAPFQKDFYIESPAVKQLSAEEVKILRLEMDGIKVTGVNVPKPIWTWDQLPLSAIVRSVMEEKLAYTKPTSIQSQALPAIMSGRDFMGVAKTGSGKTLAFVLPLLSHVQAQPPLAKGDGPVAVLLTPTRELALQIYKQLSYFTKKLGISACCCYGGSSIEPQIAELKKGSQVVVATPGRLIDLVAANNGRVCNLQRVTYIVLDEADRMFDFGFEPQVNKIFSQIRPDRQSILFSATFAKKMESLARAILKDPVEVVVGGISVVAPEITQRVEFFEVSDEETPDSIFQKKFQKLVDTLAKFKDVKKLVFVEKQDSADNLLVKLLAQKIPCVAIHGGKEQIDRKYAIREFSTKDSGVDVLIATSIAARGLDVKGLDLVVNFDPANHMEDYVHRVGRTGRAGNRGDAYTFVTSQQERPITDLVKAFRLSKVPEAEIDSRLKSITDAFLEKVKSGKEKFRFGFGGNGLNKLDDTRNSAKSMERRAYEVDAEPKTSSANKSNVGQKSNPEIALDLPEFRVVEGRAEETSGPDKCKFHSRITINDLPQKARWIVVNADSLAQIIEATSTSITNKGQYYPPKTKVPATIKQGGREVPAPPKLYLLIEGLTETAVSEAIRMIRLKMIEGLEQAAADEGSAAPGKYTV